jgi:argininosuccinate synthase
LGSALGRYLIAQELVRLAHEEGCDTVAHAAASKGNDQVRMETAIAALDPRLQVVAPVRRWGLVTLAQKLEYARGRDVPVEPPRTEAITADRNLWGVSIYLHELPDAWAEPPADVFTLTRAPEQAPDRPAVLTVGFEAGLPCSLDGQRLGPVQLVRRLNQLGGEHGVGRSDVIEDRLLSIKSREFYEAPAPALLLTAHRDLQTLVHSRELLQLKESLSRRYAELVYGGLWFHDLRRALDSFFQQTQRILTGEVRLKLYKGSCAVLGRRSPHSLYDSRLTSQANLECFDSDWAQGFTSLWTLPARLAARRQPLESPERTGPA